MPWRISRGTPTNRPRRRERGADIVVIKRAAERCVQEVACEVRIIDSADLCSLQQRVRVCIGRGARPREVAFGDPAGPWCEGRRRGTAGARSELRLRRRSPRPAGPWLEARPAAHLDEAAEQIDFPNAEVGNRR
jgi:hypothetical protein